ncbi:MAG: 2-C-methyl-D-erythritol 4-phosphate cytidylyltransferase [Candidatus Aminicenantes bacterium]|jgi:2-C-methyl-D-erythritol 4-phosphate cytidylyltransferase|nr:2-C-methyl-D-erythritol 4-phosphate cytidylyltransferase [Candidatus Aminicenantes bacterium]
MNKVTAIVVAAGEGQRFGAPKQFAPLREKPVLEWCLGCFDTHVQVAEIVLVLMSDIEKDEYMRRFPKIATVVTGGKQRQDSVMAGFNQIDPRETDFVLIHDGVRPLVDHALLSRVIAAARKNGAAVPVIAIEDTVKAVEGDKILRTVDREKLRRVQTPQGFSYPILKAALDQAREDGTYSADEAALVERMGGEVVIVEGDPRNIKITSPEDIRIAEVLLED